MLTERPQLAKPERLLAFRNHTQLITEPEDCVDDIDAAVAVSPSLAGGRGGDRALELRRSDAVRAGTSIWNHGPRRH